MGDIIYSLLFCKLLNVDAIFIDGANADVKLNWKSVDFLMPLIQHQEYISIAERWIDQKFDNNYGIHPSNIPVVVGTDLTLFHASKFIASDDKSGKWENIYQPWLKAPSSDNPLVKNKKIVINRTSRYHGDHSFYFNMLRYVPPEYLLFVGLESEYHDFCRQFNVSMDFIRTSDSLELAGIINSVPTFLGNESLACAIATGLGKTCFVEYGRHAANYVFQRQDIFYF